VDSEGSSDQDEIAFRDGSGKTLFAWKPGLALADVRFRGSHVWVNTFDTIVTVDATGNRRELFSLESGEIEMAFASEKMQVVCRKRLGRPRRMGEPRDARARCRSSAGWTFNGNWGYFSPVYCGGYLVQFEDEPGQAKGQHQWHRVIVRSAVSGDIVQTRDATGGNVSCWQESALVEVDSGRIWNLPSFEQTHTIHCGEESAAVWAEGKACPWCVGASGFLHRVVDSRTR
jgi:hypothetical protein